MKKMVERIDHLENPRKFDDHDKVGEYEIVVLEASTPSSVGDKKEHIHDVKSVSILKKKEARSYRLCSKRGHIKI